ncbi:haloacid dehalogenase superfamily, subfamily IA, variant 3 with third motif having DD or ED [Thiothrix eikelboomii]|uniref:Haloacid dehalogenase superfamily, subfamily IA, variant 3 with third motif having DD or ED n=1 Tax=Thiothrix eikelboomii TaxID=92487 RepID=A0A1T4WI02_9GAMM|nr:HAD family hydrolase [Thiothrix eikelboomii]SKA76789.1 haloacid dehalogenase superfamily, subfamily IA, variant 3 with third motif having DD or ED [Thiothrix eikelboomii]
MTQLKALLWDVDGTLADTEEHGHRVAFNQAFAEIGLEWHWDVQLYGELLQVTGGKERIQFFIDHYATPFIKPKDLKDFIAKLHQRKTHFYLERLQQGQIPLRCGVQRLIQEARAAGLRLAIVTTTTPENVSYLLAATLGAEALQWFDCIAAGDIVPKKKPAPDIYTYALAQLKLQPEECLALEDSDNGLKSAHAAGVPTLVTVNEYTKTQDFSQALLVLDHLGEPDQGITVLQGEAGVRQYVDVPLLRQLLANR